MGCVKDTDTISNVVRQKYSYMWPHFKEDITYYPDDITYGVAADAHWFLALRCCSAFEEMQCF